MVSCFQFLFCEGENRDLWNKKYVINSGIQKPVISMRTTIIFCIQKAIFVESRCQTVFLQLQYITFCEIKMYFAFYPMAIQSPTFAYMPNQTIASSPLAQQSFSQPDQSVPQISNKEEGIQISLTQAQLVEAGYQNNKKAWTEEEDALLLKLWKKKSLSWKQIALKIPGRTSKMCYSRYRRITSPLKQQWTTAQDNKIKELVRICGTNWDKISQHFKRRTSKQIKDHYINYLRPQINKEPWGLEDDLLLIKLLKNFGKNWNLIETHMNGRTQNQIKNRYFRRLKLLDDKKREEQRTRKEEPMD